jgi:hypothetical protein
MYLVSAAINFIIIAVIAAIVDEAMHARIEEHQGVGAFLIFFLPVFLEVVSYFAQHKPFIFGLL